jgi:hypothetical protein
MSSEQMSYGGYLYHGGIGYPMFSAMELTAIGANPWVQLW